MTLKISTSIGISLFPDDGETVQALISAADSALYEAKRAGKNRYCTTAQPAAPASQNQNGVPSIL